MTELDRAKALPVESGLEAQTQGHDEYVQDAMSSVSFRHRYGRCGIINTQYKWADDAANVPALITRLEL